MGYDTHLQAFMLLGCQTQGAELPMGTSVLFLVLLLAECRWSSAVKCRGTQAQRCRRTHLCPGCCPSLLHGIKTPLLPTVNLCPHIISYNPSYPTTHRTLQGKATRVPFDRRLTYAQKVAEYLVAELKSGTRLPKPKCYICITVLFY